MTESRRKRKWDVDDTGSSRTPTPPNENNFGYAQHPSLHKSLDNLIAAAKSNVASNGGLAGTAPGSNSKTWNLIDDVTITTSQEVKSDGKVVYTGNIDINDIKNKYLLTKGPTQIEIKEKTGADIITRGKYYPDRNLATEKEPPLFLHIVAQTQESLDEAVEMVKELMQQSLNLIQSRERPAQAPRQPRIYHNDKVFVGFEGERGFNVRAKIVGPAGAYVKHIQKETGARVQLKGIGSGYTDAETGREADEPLHVWVSGATEEQMVRARELVQDLVNTVKSDYDKWKAAKPPQHTGYPHMHGAMSYGAPQSMGYPQSMVSPQSTTPSSTATPAQGQQAAIPGASANPQEAYQQYIQYYQYIISQSDPQTAAYYQQYLNQYIAANPALAAASASQPATAATATAATESSEPAAKKTKTDYHSVPPPSIYGGATAASSIEPESGPKSAQGSNSNSPQSSSGRLRPTASDFFE